MMDWRRWILLPCIGVLVGWLALLGLVMLREQEQSLAPADVIFVPGCMIWGDRPSPTLQERLDLALELYDQGYAALICVSGGQGVDEQMPEAYVMRDYLIERGVAQMDILVEARSSNTRENLLYSAPILHDAGVESLLIVTSGFHRFRTVRIARETGFVVAGYAAAPVPPGQRWFYRVRETASLMKEWLFGSESAGLD